MHRQEAACSLQLLDVIFSLGMLSDFSLRNKNSCEEKKPCKNLAAIVELLYLISSSFIRMNLCVIRGMIWQPVFPECLIMVSCSSIFDKVIFSPCCIFRKPIQFPGCSFLTGIDGTDEEQLRPQYPLKLWVCFRFVSLGECYSITACVTPIPSLVKNSLLLLFVLA